MLGDQLLVVTWRNTSRNPARVIGELIQKTEAM